MVATNIVSIARARHRFGEQRVGSREEMDGEGICN